MNLFKGIFFIIKKIFRIINFLLSFRIIIIGSGAFFGKSWLQYKKNYVFPKKEQEQDILLNWVEVAQTKAINKETIKEEEKNFFSFYKGTIYPKETAFVRNPLDSAEVITNVNLNEGAFVRNGEKLVEWDIVNEEAEFNFLKTQTEFKESQVLINEIDENDIYLKNTTSKVYENLIDINRKKIKKIHLERKLLFANLTPKKSGLINWSHNIGKGFLSIRDNVIGHFYSAESPIIKFQCLKENELKKDEIVCFQLNRDGRILTEIEREKNNKELAEDFKKIREFEKVIQEEKKKNRDWKSKLEALQRANPKIFFGFVDRIEDQTINDIVSFKVHVQTFIPSDRKIGQFLLKDVSIVKKKPIHDLDTAQTFIVNNSAVFLFDKKYYINLTVGGNNNDSDLNQQGYYYDPETLEKIYLDAIKKEKIDIVRVIPIKLDFYYPIGDKAIIGVKEPRIDSLQYVVNGATREAKPYSSKKIVWKDKWTPKKTDY